MIQSLTFKDIKGTSLSGKDRGLGLKFTKAPPSKRFRTLPEITPPKAGGGQTMAPSMVDMGGKAQSLYGGLTQEVSAQTYDSLLGTSLPTLTPKVVNTALTLKAGGLIGLGVYKPVIKTRIEREQTLFPALSPVLTPKLQDVKVIKTFTPVRTYTGVGLGSGLLQKPDIKPIQIEKPIQKPFIPMPIKPIYQSQPFIPKPYVEPFFGLPNLGEIQTGGGERVRGRQEGLFGKTSYSASLGSVLLRAPKKKVTAEEYAQLSRKKYLGLGLRPQVEVVSKKKKSALGLF